MKALGLIVAASLALASCSGSGPPAAPSTAPSASSRTPQSTGPSTSAPGGIPQVTTSEAPLPAGNDPSVVSKLVCSPMAQQEINSVIGVNANVSTPTWNNHIYSCQYSYPAGMVVLTVKELSSWDETAAYYNGLQTSLGDKQSLPNLGQGAFVTTNNSVVVKKDWKVLQVDISKLPAKIGNPLIPAPQVALTFAAIILACWAGD